MKNITLLVTVGLLLQIDICFARNLNANEVENIEDFFKNITTSKSDWKSTGPTEEDIRSATRFKNLAAKGSREEQIIEAAQKGDQTKIISLITAEVDLEARDSQDRTALMRAAEKGYAEIVKVLIDAGANVHTKDNFDITAFFIAADKNHVEVVKILIDRGSGTEEKFEEVFCSAVFKGNVEMVKALVGDGTHITRDIIDAADEMTNYSKTNPMREFINDLKLKML